MWRIILIFVCITMAGCAIMKQQQSINRTTSPEAVLDTVWQWQGTDAPNDACVVKSPERYTLRFLQDGNVQAQFDCNKGGGTYMISEGKLSFGPLMSTRMACPPDSQDSRYMKDLQQVIEFFVQDDVLYLKLLDDGGIMRFRTADTRSL